MVTQLLSIFASIADASSDGSNRFATEDVPNRLGVYIGKSLDGAPAILIETSEPTASEPPIELKLVRAFFNSPAEIERGGESRQVNCCAICSKTNDPEMVRFFFCALAGVVDSLPPHPSSGEVAQSIRRVVQLFAKLTTQPKGSIQGLWAELAVICWARDPDLLVSTWHDDPNDLFDFILDSAALEIKSHSGPNRVHLISHEQVCPPAPIKSVFASIRCIPTHGGHSLQDMIETATNRLASAAGKEKLNSVVAAVLGETIEAALRCTFDISAARNSLLFFRDAGVPRLRPPIPPGVTGVRYFSDFSKGEPTSPDDLANSPIWLASTPEKWASMVHTLDTAHVK